MMAHTASVAFLHTLELRVCSAVMFPAAPHRGVCHREHQRPEDPREAGGKEQAGEED